MKQLVVSLLLCFSLSFIFAKTDVKVGWFPYEKLQEIDEHGKPYGYNYDYLQVISSSFGYNFSFVVDTYESCLKKLQNGEIDILGCIPEYDEFKSICNFSSLWEPLSQAYLCANRENETEFFADPKRTYNIAVLKDSVGVSAFKDYAKKNKIKNYSLIECTTMQTVEMLVQDGYVDLGIFSLKQDSARFTEIVEFTKIPMKFAVSKQKNTLLNELNDIAIYLASTQPWIYDDLYSLYELLGKGVFVLTEEERLFIEKNPSVKIAWADVSPYLFSQDPDTKKYSGFLVALFNKISESSGIQFEYVKCDTLHEVIETVQEAPENVICFIDRSVLRNGNLPFEYSIPIMNFPIDAIRLKNANTTSTKTGVIQDKKTFAAVSFYSENSFIEYDSAREAFKALNKGDIYQILGNTFTVYSVLNDSYENQYIVEHLLNEEIDICFAQHESVDTSLLLILSKVISSIPSLEITRTIMQSSIYVTNAYRQSMIKAIPWFMLTFAIFVFVAFLVFLIFALIKKNQHSKYLASQLFTDGLTLLLSQKGFDAFVNTRLAKSDCKDWAIILFDIDGFGYYNAMFGYEQGDALLKSISKCCVQQTEGEELCAHLNGDNFVFFINDAEKSAETRIKYLMSAIQDLVPSYRINLSFGVFKMQYIENGNMDSMEMLTSAKLRDYAKLAQRSIKGDIINSVGYYNYEMHKQKLQENLFAAEMHRGIKNNEFKLYFQPKYDCKETIQGAECLVRWEKTNGDIIQPSLFIPVFERNGFILKLDMYVFEKACKLLQNQKARGLNPIPLSTNFSRGHVYNNNFARELAEIAGKYDIEPSLLEIELTESVFCENPYLISDVISSLHSYGFTVSVDDFGSGYSSLNMLKDAEFDSIKIDQVFFKGDLEKIKKVVSCILSLAKDLGMKTVAEGVESVAQYNFLKENGCDLIQGFYFSKPVDVQTLNQLL